MADREEERNKVAEIGETGSKAEMPWDEWLIKTKTRLNRVRAESEAKKETIYDIPFNDEDWLRVQGLNNEFRKLVSNPENAVFYRPGIGWGGALREMLEKAGSFTTMIVTDPVYRQTEMIGWSEGTLPIEYYYETLKLLEADQIGIEIVSPTGQVRKLEETQIESAEIREGEEAKYKYVLNGVKHSLTVAGFDMTAKSPGHYDIISFGQPTPYNDETTKDPRNSEDFVKMVVRDLKPDGIVHYFKQSFRFMPPYLPESAFGFKSKFDNDKEVIVQKVKERPDGIEAAIRAVTATLESFYAISGSLQYPEAGFPWLPHIDELSKIMKKEEPFTYDDVINNFRKNLTELAKFADSLNEDERKELINRLEFLIVAPISTDRKVDIDKLQILRDASPDPDKARDPERDSFSPPYFGNMKGIIKDNNDGKMDIVEYYQQLTDIFYQNFPDQTLNNQG